MSVPRTWRPVRLRYLCDVNPAAHRLAGPIAFAPMDAVGVLGGIRFEQMLDKEDVSTGLSYFEENDVIVAKITPCFENGKCALAENVPGGRALGSTEFHVIRPGSAVLPKFLFYVCASTAFREPGEAQMYGAAGQKRVPTDFVKDFSLSLPGKPAQRAIAEFLDRETLRIDGLLAKKQHLIELLDEKRAALISRAVTQGLDLGVAMKDSGVEWLGSVPTHWDVAPLNSRFDVKLGKMLDARQITGQQLVPYLRNVDVQWDQIAVSDLPSMDFDTDDRERFRLRPGDLIVCEGGEVGRAAVWQGQLMECCYQKALHRLRPRGSDVPRFLLYVLRSAAIMGVFRAGSNQNTIDHLTSEKLRAHRFAFPPAEEQSKISAFLDETGGLRSPATSLLTTTIALLREYRSALITAAVTGQLDIHAHEKKMESLA
jgi:type I restriction enzyme S subunit